MVEMSDPSVTLSVPTKVSLKAKWQLNVLTVKMVLPDGLHNSQFAHLAAPGLHRLKAEISTVQKINWLVNSW